MTAISPAREIHSAAVFAPSIRFAGRLPKAGSADDECEDAFAFAAPPLAEDSDVSLRAAVADGASDSVFAGEWAQGVADTFVAAASADLAEALGRAGTQWRDFAADQTLPWFAEPKRARGAFAAFVGIEVQKERRATVTAVGDSCAFLVRKERLAVSFPFQKPSDFTTLPFLVGTSDGLPSDSEHVHRWNGPVFPADDWYLMTDALSAWFLTEAEAGHEPWRWLRDIGDHRESQRAFRERIAVLRDGGRLRNDDVALLHVRLTPVSVAAD